MKTYFRDSSVSQGSYYGRFDFVATPTAITRKLRSLEQFLKFARNAGSIFTEDNEQYIFVRVPGETDPRLYPLQQFAAALTQRGLL